MLLIALLWGYIFALALPLGLGAVRLARFVLRDKSNQTPPTDVILLVGVLIISLYATAVATFTAVGGGANAVLCVLAAILAWHNAKALRKTLQRGRQNAVLLAMVASFVLLFATQSAGNCYDTGLYHAQAIAWLREYGMVAGLGNLHGRLAFASLSFPAHALLTVGFGNEAAYPLNSFLLCCLIFRLFKNMVRGVKRKVASDAAFYALLLFGMCLAPVVALCAAPTPDLFAAIFALYTFIALYERAEISSQNAKISSRNAKISSQTTRLATAAFILFAPAVKLSAVAVLLSLPLVVVWQRRFVIAVVVVAGGIAGLYFYQNFILSGYLLYPFPRIDVFQVGWKVPTAAAAAEQQKIVAWARIAGVPHTAVLAMPFAQWFGVWCRHTQPFWIAAAAGGLVASGLSLGAIKAKKYARAWLYAVIFANTVFWLAAAPDPRFAYATLLTAFALVGAAVCSALWQMVRKLACVRASLPLRWRATYIYVAFFAVMLLLNARRIHPETLLQRAWLPTALPMPLLEEVKAENFTATTPINDDRCFGSTPPCTPTLPTCVKMRGKALCNGFQASDTAKLSQK